MYYGGAGVSMNKGVELESQFWVSEYQKSANSWHASSTWVPYHGTGNIQMLLNFEPKASTWVSDCDNSTALGHGNCPTQFVRAYWTDNSSDNLAIEINGDIKTITKQYPMSYTSKLSDGTLTGISGGDQWYEMRLSVTPSGNCTED